MRIRPLLFALILLTPLKIGALESFKVLIFPFSLHQAEDLHWLGEAAVRMLSSRLEREGGILTMEELRKGVLEEEAIRIGLEKDADFVILGKIKKIGEVINLEVSVLDTKKKRPKMCFSDSAKELGAFSSLIGDLVSYLSLRLQGKEVVSKVSVEGNRRIESQAILARLETKKGGEFSPETIEKDLKKIYEMGYLSDIKVESKDTPYGKEITFLITEKPIISEIRIQGNKAIETPEIKKAIGLKLHDILDVAKVREEVKKLHKLYTDKGYYKAEVDYRLDHPKKDEVVVSFLIKEGKIIKIKKISFKGTKDIKEKTLKIVMDIKEKGLFSFLTGSGVFKPEVFQRDIDKLSAFYYSKGYIEAKVDKPDIRCDKKGIYITIPIYEGRQFKVGRVDIEGDLIEKKVKLLKGLRTLPGMVFNGGLLRDDILYLTSRYADRGFAFVDVSPLTSIDSEKKVINLTFHIDKGKKVYFERVNITGNTKTRDNVIRRELKIAEGDLYSQSLIQKSREAINNLGFFEKVNLNTSKGTAEDKIEVNVEVGERPTGMFSAGGGFSSSESVIGTFQISESNLFGKGQKLNLTAQLGGRTSRYNLGFTEPWLFETKPISGGFDIFNIEKEYDDFTLDSKGGDLRSGFPLAELTRGNLAYRYEKGEISDVDYDASYELKKEEEKGGLVTSSLLAGVTRDSLDDRFSPSRGSAASLSAELSGLGGDNYFTKYIGSASRYFPLFWDTTFMVQGEAGYGQGFRGKDLPIFERFFLGGLNSVRGYEVRSIGPRDPETGDVVGGEKEIVFNLEYIFPILKEIKLKGLVFFDAGACWGEVETEPHKRPLKRLGDWFKGDRGYWDDGWNDRGYWEGWRPPWLKRQEYEEDFYMRTSVGFGFRWFSPMGPLRVECGYPLNPKKYDEKSTFEFSIGTFFR